MKSIADILKDKGLIRDYRNKYEFQAYGNMLAEKLRDKKHRSLYIKLAKEEKRELLEQALDFVIDSGKKRNLGRLFMWKLTQLKKQKLSN